MKGIDVSERSIFKALLPGIILSFVMGFVMTMLLGGGSESLMPKYMSGGMSCFMSVFFSIIFGVNGAAKKMGIEIKMSKLVLRAALFGIGVFIVGIAFIYFCIEMALDINLLTMPMIQFALIAAVLGVAVSTPVVYFLLKNLSKGTTQLGAQNDSL